MDIMMQRPSLHFGPMPHQHVRPVNSQMLRLSLDPPRFSHFQQQQQRRRRTARESLLWLLLVLVLLLLLLLRMMCDDPRWWLRRDNSLSHCL
jgi:uncharacterized membrane protein affecting hemolysin expression